MRRRRAQEETGEGVGYEVAAGGLRRGNWAEQKVKTRTKDL